MVSTKKIYLVDDEIGIIQSLKRELFPWAIENNFALATAQTGSEALEMVKDEPDNVALVISDIKMPDMRGSDLLLEVNRLFPNIMTILLTGYAETEDMLKAIKAGTFSYILKPWDRFYLLSEVKKAMDIYTLREENRRNTELMKEELRWAGELQRRILDVDLPPSADFEIRYEPMGDLVCGGDYYDVLSSGDDRYALAIGDVSGQGVRAAFVTSILKTLLSATEAKRVAASDPALLLSQLNRQLCEELRNLQDIVIPFGLCSIDLAGYRLKFANAGHLPVHIVRKGSVIPVRAAGPALGFVSDAEYESTEVGLMSGDCVVLFTDGLYRSEESVSEQESRRKLYELLQNASTKDRFASALVDSALKARTEPRFDDDVTVVSVRIS